MMHSLTEFFGGPSRKQNNTQQKKTPREKATTIRLKAFVQVFQ